VRPIARSNAEVSAAQVSGIPVPEMPVRRGHVAPRTTIIETIIRKFDTHGELAERGMIKRK